MRADRQRILPYGVEGGAEGTPSVNVLNPDTEPRKLPSKFGEHVKQGDLFRHLTAGVHVVYDGVDATLFSLTELLPHERDPQSYVDLLGNSTLYLTLLDPGSPAWPDRLASLLSRMHQVPRFLSDARVNLKNPPRVISDIVIKTNAGNIAFFEKTAPSLFGRAPESTPTGGFDHPRRVASAVASDHRLCRARTWILRTKSLVLA